MSHEPVLVVADEQIGVRPAEESAGDALPSPEAGNNQLNQLMLAVLAAEDVLVGPPVRNTRYGGGRHGIRRQGSDDGF